MFLELEIDKAPVGRVVISLSNYKAAPKTCENFRQLCTGEAGYSKRTGKPLSYRGTIFHRVIPGFMMQGGDFTKFNGTGNESIYGAEGTQPQEPFTGHHNRKGIVSMAKNGPVTNGSQFFVTFSPAPWLDGQHTVVGEVVEGFEVCQKAERVRTDANDKPVQRVVVVGCGEITESREKEEKRNSPSRSSYSSSSSYSSQSEEEKTAKKRERSRSGSASSKSRHRKRSHSGERRRHGGRYHRHDDDKANKHVATGKKDRDMSDN